MSRGNFNADVMLQSFIGQSILTDLVNKGYDFRIDENNCLKAFSSNGIKIFNTEDQFQNWLDEQKEIMHRQ